MYRCAAGVLKVTYHHYPHLAREEALVHLTLSAGRDDLSDMQLAEGNGEGVDHRPTRGHWRLKTRTRWGGVEG